MKEKTRDEPGEVQALDQLGRASLALSYQALDGK